MTTANQTCLIIGASHAGACLATAVRKEGWEGRILVLGDETVMPYHRPPLSKALLMQEKTADHFPRFGKRAIHQPGITIADLNAHGRIVSAQRFGRQQDAALRH